MSTEYLSHRNVQLKELDILVLFDAFCKEHNIKYSLIGGTLLGAMRHKGFIPWDDDIDVCAARPEYDKLIRLRLVLESDTGMKLLGCGGTDPEESPFVKLANTQYKVKAEKEYYESYLWIDIFPVDALPTDAEQLKRIYSRASKIRAVLFLALSTKESSCNMIRRFIKGVAGPILRANPHVVSKLVKKLNSYNHKISYGETPFVGVIGWGQYGIREKMLLKDFERIDRIEFEGKMLPTMACRQQYMSALHGNYMELPPVEKRISHGIKVWRIGD